MATRQTYFFDFTKKGDLLGLRDLTMITNEQAVMESIYNILLTQPGERIMSPLFGCDLNAFLFEPIADYNAAFMKSAIEVAIKRDELRVNNLEVEVIPDEDNLTYIINIKFSINTTSEQQVLQTTLKKVR